MEIDIKDKILDIIEEHKARDINVIDLQGKSSIADYMIVATGTSNRQLKAMADKIDIAFKKDFKVRIEGGRDGTGWILVDAFDVIVHLFMEEVRTLYDIESLWQEEFFTKRG